VLLSASAKPASNSEFLAQAFNDIKRLRQ